MFFAIGFCFSDKNNILSLSIKTQALFKLFAFFMIRLQICKPFATM